MDWCEVLGAAPDLSFEAELRAFLMSVDLASERPSEIDHFCLAPLREAGLVRIDQCGSSWCNVGLVLTKLPIQTPAIARFAIGSATLTKQFSANSIPLKLRAHFISTKGFLTLAASEESTSPSKCRRLLKEAKDFVAALDEHLEAIDPSGLGQELASTFNATVEALWHVVVDRHALGSLDDDIAALVDVQISLASRIDPELMERVWHLVMTGFHAGVFLRLVGALGCGNLALDREDLDMARRAVSHADALLSRGELADEWKERIALVRATMLHKLGRVSEALAQLRLLPASVADSVRRSRATIEAWCLYELGDLSQARALLNTVAATPDDAVQDWRTQWVATTPGGNPITDLRLASALENSQPEWRLLALIDAKLGDLNGAQQWMEYATGFLVDSLIKDRLEWIATMRARLSGPAINFRAWAASTEWNDEIEQDLLAPNGLAPTVPQPTAAVSRPNTHSTSSREALREILESGEGRSALIEILSTEHGILTFSARLREGEVQIEPPSTTPRSNELFGHLRNWDHYYLKRLRHNPKIGALDADAATLFERVLAETENIFGEVVMNLVAEGITDLMFVVDDLVVDLPIHAIRLRASGQRLIDHVRVSYAPSVYALWVSQQRNCLATSGRRAPALRGLIDLNLPAANAEATDVAGILGSARCDLDPTLAQFWTQMSEAEVLHIVAHGRHNVLTPLNSLVMAGWVDLGLTKLVAGLDLPRCDVVSNLICESAYPAVRRAPGLDISSVFLAAGARTVLASTWVVRDDIASRFCRLFFEHWVSGTRPAQAFQESVVRLRKDEPEIPDWCWAGLRLVGGR
jgi:hypothetical protein